MTDNNSIHDIITNQSVHKVNIVQYNNYLYINNINSTITKNDTYKQIYYILDIIKNIEDSHGPINITILNKLKVLSYYYVYKTKYNCDYSHILNQTEKNLIN